uniref:Ras association domain family member 7 n=1 Tax=Nothoprocta perdicaria TaxID=30464 RepID=A0A8C6YJV1_NOTPE
VSRGGRGMELKVWVDGIQRVVCGVSQQTTCQEVVVALARAIGQTGRYVLVQKLREKERQLLPLECPLESLAKCGQYANDVQFVLRRTGPSVAERPSSDGAPHAPERTFIRASLPIKPRPMSTEVPRSREPKKAMTFNLGPMGSGELFTVLRQVPSQEDEIFFLEQLVRRNETELGEEEFWQSELRLEKECERERQERVRSLRASLEDYTQRIYELSARTEALQKEIQWEMAERAKRGKETPGPSTADLEDMAAKMKRDLEAKVKQGTQLESNLASVEKALEEAERNLQAQNRELEELNKELRQCNLQQFIQQTGATVTVAPARPEEDAPLGRAGCEAPAQPPHGGQRPGSCVRVGRGLGAARQPWLPPA